MRRCSRRSGVARLEGMEQPDNDLTRRGATGPEGKREPAG